MPCRPERLTFTQAGTNARGYVVSTICTTTRRSIERKYAPFLAEICRVNDPELDIKPDECARRRRDAVIIITRIRCLCKTLMPVISFKDLIYTRLPLAEMVNNVSMSRIWIPAYVIVTSRISLTDSSFLLCNL